MDWTQIYFSATACNVASMVASSIGISLYAVRKYKYKMKSTLQLKMGVWLLFTDFFFSLGQILTNYIVSPPFWCEFAVWLWIIGTELSVFYTIAIVHNVHRSVLGFQSNLKVKWENVYFYTPLVLSLIISLIPVLSGNVGFDDYYQACWFNHDNLAVMEWISMFSWVVLCAVYSMIIITMVIIKISNRSGTKSSTRNTGENKEEAQGSRSFSRKIFFLLAPYPIILILCQMSSIVDVFYPSDSRTYAWSMFDLCSSGFQGIFHLVLILRNPNLLSGSSTSKDLMELILNNNELLQKMLEFTKQLLCQENIEFYIDVKNFKESFTYDVNENLYRVGLNTIFLKKEIQRKHFIESPLNIPGDMFSQMSNVLKGDLVSYEMFDDVVDHVKTMILNDSIPKFVKSKEYKEIEAKIELEKVKTRLNNQKSNVTGKGKSAQAQKSLAVRKTSTID